CKISLA
ncbi:hypothetical protein VCCP1035_1803B, partial [Vibrio cholerae CP1035(8)]